MDYKYTSNKSDCFCRSWEDVSINATEENFGFPKATTQNNDALVQHKAIIKNLETGKTYTYRVVSRSHPSAVATVDEARTLVIFNSNLPLKITAVPVTTPILITVTSNTHTDINTHTDNHIGNNVNSTPSMTNKQTSVQDTDQTTIADVPAAITAITDIDTSTPLLSSSLFARLKQTFSFDFNLSNKLGFLLPTFVILFAVYLLQQAILPMLGITVEHTMIFWMFSLIVLAIASALMKYYKITLVMIAISLALLAWYLVKEAGGDDKAQWNFEN